MRLNLLESVGLLKPEEKALLRQTNPFLPGSYYRPVFRTDGDNPSITLDFS